MRKSKNGGNVRRSDHGDNVVRSDHGDNVVRPDNVRDAGPSSNDANIVRPNNDSNMVHPDNDANLNYLDNIVEQIRLIQARMEQISRKVDSMYLLQRMNDDIMRKSANSINVAVRLLAVSIVFAVRLVIRCHYRLHLTL